VVRIFTGYDYGDLARGTQESKVIGAIAASARRAQEQGILLSVQNHHDLAVHTKEFSLLLDTIKEDNVRAGYDAWSPHLRGEDLYSGARAMASRMFMTICADYLSFPRYRYQPELVNYLRVEPDSVKATMMGQGEIDYGAFFRGLKDGGFGSAAASEDEGAGEGWAIYEMCSPVVGGGSMENLDRHARAFLAWLEKNV
jgi:sugar phosphate isomerase/epimerase